MPGATAVTAGATSAGQSSSHRLRDRPWLLVAAIAVPVAEVVVLWSVGLSADRALAPEVTAPSPMAEFHDLRWLMVLQDSWLALAAEAGAVLVLRSLLNAVLVHQAWWGDDRPTLLALWRRTAIASLALGIFIAPWAALAFGVDMVSISWLSFAALPPILLVALISPHGPVSRGWWHQVPPRRAVGWVVLIVIETTLTGAVVHALPAAGWVPAVAAGGLFNAWAWRGVVGAVTGRAGVRRRFVPVVPVVAVGMVGVAVIGTAVAFSLVGRPSPIEPSASASTRGGARTNLEATPGAAAAGQVARRAHAGPPVVVVSGFDTSWDGASTPPIPGRFDEQRFSYRGLGASGQPLPYTAADTHRSVRTTARLLATQVEMLHRATGQPVSIVAESEGELVARVYAAAVPAAPIARLVLLSPLDEPGRVYYPLDGHEGYGLMTGYELRGLTAVLGGISPVQMPADSPFLRSIVDHAGDLRNLLSCPANDTPEEIIEPLADAVVDPASPAPGVPTIVLPAFHGGLLSDTQAQADVEALLQGKRPAPSASGLAGLETTLRLASASWQVPALPLSLYPTPGGGGSDSPTCSAMAAHIQAWIGLPDKG